MFNKISPEKNAYMLTGSFRRKGYDWWWHSFTAHNETTGEEKAFFIEFFICNPALAEDEPVFGQLPENRKKGKRPSYLMVKAGCWGKDARQLHRFFSLKQASVHASAPYAVTAGDCYASDSELRGSVCVSPDEAAAHPEWMCGAGSMQWELRLDKQIAFDVGYGTSRFCRAIKAFEMYWHAAGMKTLYSGWVMLDGVKYIVSPESSYGYADKNWGRGFTSPWVWLSSNHLVSNVTGKELDNSVFDIGGGRPKVYFLPLERKLLGAVYYQGEEMEFNFSKFWTGSKTVFSMQETGEEIVWHVMQSNRRLIMEADVRCRKSDMLLVNYEAPDGSKRHNRLFNGGNATGIIRLWRRNKKGRELIDELSATNIGCEYGEYDSQK